MIPFVTRSILLLLLLSSFSIGTMVVHAADHAPEASVDIHVKISSSATYEHNILLTKAEALRILKNGKEEQAAHPAGLTDIFVTVNQLGKTSDYRMEKSGTLWNEAALTRLVLPPKATMRLQEHAHSLRTRHYGAIPTWSEVNASLPKQSMFTIVDMEKGLSFRVQRRAGSRHADVQPLTKEDTKTMKQIFDERWSWDRRAILVVTDNNTAIAASMNGMPHGGDGIPENGFSGHFCVHFLDSSTHRSVHPDLFHQLMVYTAAGKRADFLNSLSPDMLAETFIGALAQRNPELLRTVLEGVHAETLDHFLKEVESDTTYRRMYKKGSTLTDKEYGLTEQFFIPVLVKRKNQTEQSVNLQCEFARESIHSPWRIRQVQLTRE